MKRGVSFKGNLGEWRERNGWIQYCYALKTIEIKDQYNNTTIKLTRSLISTYSKNVLNL